MFKLVRYTICCIFAYSIASLSNAQQTSALQITRAKTPPVLSDYRLGKPVDAGVEISDFRQRLPSDGSPVSLPTKAYLSYDDTHFYAIFVAQDDPAQIRARIAKREAFEGDDYVTLDLDTFHDQRRAFTFFVNPYGVQLDAKRTEGLDLDIEFNTQWHSEGEITANGYLVKIAIPLKSLRFKSADVQTWGIAVGRVIARFNEESYWPELSKRVAGVVPQFAPAIIPEKLSAGRNLQINPFVYAGKSKLLTTQDYQHPEWQTQSNLQSGLDAKWVLGDATAIDITLRPDFSEVESDEPQILTGKRYEQLFPEKRPFFLENAGFFTSPTPLFFSRRISEPSAGVRVTGRSDAWAYGGLIIDDKAPGKQQSLPQYAGKSTHISMIRGQNDLNQSLSIGALVTDRRFAHEQNTVFGMDARYQFGDNWIFQGQLANSQAQNLAGLKSHGQLQYLDAKYKDNHTEFSAKYLAVNADFDTSLAFLPRTDVRQLQQEGKYLWHFPEHDWLQSLAPVFNSEITRNQKNQLQDWMLDTGLIAEAIRSSYFEVFAKASAEKYMGNKFHKHGWQINAGSHWWDWLEVSAQIISNEAINYLPAQDMAATLGNSRTADLTLALKPHPQWRIEEKLLWNDLRTKTEHSGVAAGSQIYRDLMLRSKLSYQYDRFWGIRLIADYHSLKANPHLSTLKTGKQLNTDVQISYVLSPGTTFYTGFGNQQENLSWVGNPARLEENQGLDISTGRRFFIKLSYVFQP